MKPDNELLALAAKAAGLQVEPCENGWDECYPMGWNPITSVADRYELCKKLGLLLNFTCQTVVDDDGFAYWSSDEDEGRVITEFAGRVR